MYIKQALKRKNKLINLVNAAYSKIREYNVVEEGNERPYSIKEVFKEWQKLTKELIELKTKIHIANAPVYGKIFELAELKNQITNLKMLNCSSGKTQPRWAGGEVSITTAEISVKERDDMIKDIEEKIEAIQDDLDTWNYETKID